MIQWLTRDWGLKVISLILAIGIWHFAVGEEEIEVARVVPLEITVKNSQMSILRTSAEHVQVTFMAQRSMVSDLTAHPVRAVHEIGAEVSKAGDYSFRLEPREIKYQIPQVRIVRIDPEVIQVTLDEVIVQKVAVKPNYGGEPAFGYQILDKQVQLNPNAVMVEGPKGQIEKLQFINTEKIDLVGRVRSFRRTVPVETPPNVRTVSESLIDVYIPIQEQFQEKKFSQVPVKVLTPPAGKESFSIQPSEISFELEGSKSQLDKMAADNILAYVDISSLSEGEHDVPVQIPLPEEVRLKGNPALAVKAIIKK